MFRRLWRFVVAATLAALFPVALSAQPTNIAGLHVNDTYSRLDAFGPKDPWLNGTLGGLAKAAAVIKRAEARAFARDESTLLLHAGDASVGDFFWNQYLAIPAGETRLGLEATSTIASGGLVSDEIIVQITGRAQEEDMLLRRLIQLSTRCFVALVLSASAAPCAPAAEAGRAGQTPAPGAKAARPRSVAPVRDIVDLLDERAIEIKTAGDGIETVSVQIRKLVAGPVAVRIPVGAFFVAASASSQNMVATGERTVRLLDNLWHTVAVPTACANRPKGIPESGDTFSVQRSPHQAELAQLMPVLDKAGVKYEVRQAAVWIVTDNADYDDLGILVASSTGYGGSRVIHEAETARAMKICADAGIDITKKAVWRDRTQILIALPAGALRTWLAGMQ
jgi:hypothetical protein